MPDEKKEEKKFDIASLSGVEKSAILMLSLTEADAAQIFRHLEPKQVQRLGMAMASMQDFSQQKVAAVRLDSKAR